MGSGSPPSPAEFRALMSVSCRRRSPTAKGHHNPVVPGTLLPRGPTAGTRQLRCKAPAPAAVPPTHALCYSGAVERRELSPIALEEACALWRASSLLKCSTASAHQGSLASTEVLVAAAGRRRCLMPPSTCRPPLGSSTNDHNCKEPRKPLSLCSTN
jgi:hypothetical protein